MRAITSRQNPIVRTFRDAAASDADGARLLIDGAHLVREASSSGVAFDVVAVAASRLNTESEEGALARALDTAGVDVVTASESVFAALSPVKHPSGIVAIGRREPSPASAVLAHPHALVLVAVDVQDPGNVGALIRVAEAGGATGALLCGQSAAPFSWRALRGSMGSAFRLPVAAGTSVADMLACVRKSGMKTVASVPRGGAQPDAIDWRGRVALLLGGEGPGLPDAVVDACDVRVTIPMAAAVESLNVAVAGAILIYAARRQRG